MHVRGPATLLTVGLVIAGCAHRPPPGPAAYVAPDPFGYQKRSAVCTVGPVSGNRVTMATRSDDGLCAVAVATPDGTAYASFLLQAPPAHGKAFIHNYNNQTLIDYTATTAYAGPDGFTVSLVPASGVRVPLTVAVAVDATGIARPAPAAEAAPAATSSPHRATGKRTVAKRKRASRRTS